MFCLYLLLRPRRRRTTVYAARYGRTRFNLAWYWLSGFFLIEALFWEVTGCALALWWLLWLGARHGTEFAARADRNCVRWEVPRWIEVSRPVWPRPAGGGRGALHALAARF
jgi:hypothetical protein